MTLNGHNHIDHIMKIGSIINFHGGTQLSPMGEAIFAKSYLDEIHAKFSYIEYTCPYKDSKVTPR